MLMSYKQIFTEEEHPIFEFRNVSLNNVMNIIGDLKSFHPRQIIFNEYDSINKISLRLYVHCLSIRCRGCGYELYAK